MFLRETKNSKLLCLSQGLIKQVVDEIETV